MRNASPTSTESGLRLTRFVPLRLRFEETNDVVEVTRTPAFVGRQNDADVRLVAPDVSRRHCRIVLEDGLWRVQDMGSTNGVFLNDHRFTDAVLYPGDRLRIGSVAFVVERATPQRRIRGKRPRTASPT